MFPHDFDRYRLMGFLLRQARKSLRRGRYTQEQLGEKAGGISQAIISNLESFARLESFAQTGNKPTTRETLIEIATLGLNLSPRDIDALLWLFDGEEFTPLDEGEIRYCKTYDKDARPLRYDDHLPLRRHVLDLLDKWLARKNVRFPRKVEARMITDWNEVGQLEFRHELLNMESKPGQRMLVSKYPSFLTYPNSLRGKARRGSDASLSEEGQEKAAEINDMRREVFIKNLSAYGERCIHSIRSLKIYLSDDFEHRLDLSQRKEQIENLILLLKKHENFEIALANVEPEIELEIKSTVSACLRGTEKDTYYEHEKPILCGPLYIYWYDVITLFSIYRNFEQIWDDIPANQREKGFVINLLQDALASTS